MLHWHIGGSHAMIIVQCRILSASIMIQVVMTMDNWQPHGFRNPEGLLFKNNN